MLLKNHIYLLFLCNTIVVILNSYSILNQCFALWSYEHEVVVASKEIYIHHCRCFVQFMRYFFNYHFYYRYAHLLPKDEEAFEHYSTFSSKRLDEVFMLWQFIYCFFFFIILVWNKNIQNYCVG